MKTKANCINVEMVSISNVLSYGIHLIELFNTKNKITTPKKFKVKIDTADTNGCAGWYFYEDDVYSIFINPEECGGINELLINDLGDCSFRGYVEDASVPSILIHEYCHYLCNVVYLDFREDYKKQFPTQRFFMSKYVNKSDIEEEIVEAMRLYILNPYLLKLINLDIYKFMKGRIKNIFPSSIKFMYSVYKDYPVEVKKELEKKWNIVYNVDTSKFEKIG